MELDRIMKRVDELLPPQAAVRLRVEKGETGLFDSKIGGTPYFPRDMEYPRGRNNGFEGQPLVLLAQLNFDRLPHIPDFPTKGILQFFIAGDDMYGMSTEFGEVMTRQDNFRVIYHENVLTDESKLLRAEEIPQYDGSDECLLPFSGEYRLVDDGAGSMSANVFDYRFAEAFVKSYNELAEEPVERLWDIDEEIVDSLYDVDFPDAVMGGYPIFAQSDPREDERIADCDVLLFELDSCYDSDRGVDVLWGDNGTGTFMIPRSSLKALDFSRVLYNYDCG